MANGTKRSGRLTVVVPAYDEEKSVRKAAEAIAGVFDGTGIDGTVLFVDDGSKDGTWDEIEKAAERDPRVSGIRFSRNFGKEAAMAAGLAEADGDCVAVMDCDLQHPPWALAEMYAKWTEGFDVVEGEKEDRGNESGFRASCAEAFYAFMSKAVGSDMSRSSDFKLLDAAVAKAIAAMPEKAPFFRAQPSWIGFPRTTVRYSTAERTEGESKWSFLKLADYAFQSFSAYAPNPAYASFALAAAAIVAAVLLLAASASAESARLAVFAGLAAAFGITWAQLGILCDAVHSVKREALGRPRYVIWKRTESGTPVSADGNGEALRAETEAESPKSLWDD